MLLSEREAKLQLSKLESSWEKVYVLKHKVIIRDDELKLQNGVSNSKDGHNSDAKIQIGQVILSPTIYEIGDWVKFKRGITTHLRGWQGARPKSIGFVKTIREKEDMFVTFCSGEARVLASEVAKMILLDIGQRVKLRKEVREPRFGRRSQSRDSVVLYVDEDKILRVAFPKTSRGLKTGPAEIECADKLKVGDMVKMKTSISSMLYGWENIALNRNGVMHDLDEDGDVGIAFCFRSKLISYTVTDIEKVVSYHEGQEIHMIQYITQPQLGWSNETPTTIGKIMRINMDGTLSAHVTGRQTLQKVSLGAAELVSVCELGDWVRVRSEPSLGSRASYDWFSLGRDSIAVVHSIQEADYLELDCCFQKGRWSTHYTDYTFIDCDHVSGHDQMGDTLIKAIGKIKLREMRDLIGVQDLARKSFKLKGENVGLSLKEKET